MLVGDSDGTRLEAAGRTVELGPFYGDLRAPARPDGYRPITEMLWVWPNFAGPPTDDAWRYTLALARRLDTAHRQVERLRDIVDRAVAGVERSSGTSPGLREELFAALGEAELFAVALYRALAMTEALSERLDVSPAAPDLVRSSLPAVKELREACEHIDERALGLKRQRPDPGAISLFELQGFLFQERILRYHQVSLGIDEEATRLMISARDYVVRRWADLCAMNNPRPDTSG